VAALSAEKITQILDEQQLLHMLPEGLRGLVAGAFELISLGIGDVIVREGEPADAFYVVVSGRARVLKAADDGSELPLNVMRPGDSFGEAALLAGGARTATVRASGDVTLLKLDRSVFDALVEQQPEIRRYLELRTRHLAMNSFLRSVPAFARLPIPTLLEVLQELERVELAAGERVVTEGQPADALYLVEQGRLRTYTEGEGERAYRSYLRAGDFFGEIALFQGGPRTATVEALTPVQLLRMRERTFRRLVREHPDFKKHIEEHVARYDYRRRARIPLDFAEELLPSEALARPVGREQISPEESDEEEGQRAGPFASVEGYFRGRRPRIRRFPFVAQIDETDCAAACLAMVCRHLGRRVGLTSLRERLHVGPDGTSLAALCRGAESLGLAARSVKASRSNLLEMPLPAILHWGGNHWVVLYDVDETRARIADPAHGLRSVSREKLDAEWSGYAALFDYTRDFESAPEDREGLAWLWRFVRPHTGVLARGVGVAVVAAGLQMVFPVGTQVIVDRVLVDRDIALLRTTLLVMLALLGLMLLSWRLQHYLMSWAAVRIDSSTLDFIMRRLLDLPMSYFYRRRTGDLQRRLDGARDVREFLVQSGVSVVTSATQLAAALVVMLVYSPLLTGIFLITAPLYVLLSVYSRRRLRPLFAELEESFGRYRSHQIDAVKGMETVKSIGGESGFRNRMLEEFHLVASRIFRSDLTIMNYETMVQGVGLFSSILFLGAGAIQVIDGAISIGAFVAFNALVMLANRPILVALSEWDRYQLAAVLVTRLDDILKSTPEQGDAAEELKPVPTLEGRVTLHGLGFRYGGPESPAIVDCIDLDVAPLSTVAIVGRSGSGKTTLAKLLAGLLEPSEGTILFDAVDRKTLRLRELRRQIGFVLQDTYLFDDTLARNIAFGEAEPDMDRVLWAARAANASDFIERLPLGYETRVGESGLRLSGGQSQRVAIARALYGRPPIVILDEATSALDSESEKAVQENMARLFETCTTFVIAHRLSTIRDADWIVVLEKGAVAEQGTHEQLMARQGLYYYLCSQQLEL